MTLDRSVRAFLVIDDDKVLCDVIRDYFSSATMEVLIASSGAAGLSICSQKKVDVVLLDQKLPDVEGHSLCVPILKHNDQTKIIFITAFPSLESAVVGLRAGAFDYLSKPFELEELEHAVTRAFRTIDLEVVEQFQKYRSRKESEETVILGREGGGGLSEIGKLIDLAADSDAPVLITGETGTGKDLVARSIHYKNHNDSAGFIEANCAALPESLIEAELFGYEKGAFTGAVSSKKGIFEMAEGGTLLLNEIGEMPLNLQAKLLSVLEGKKIKRLGGDMIAPVSFRVIAATNVDLEKALGKTFREDLYYRLSVIRIHVPPLRERRQDIPELCRHLLRKIARNTEAEIEGDEINRMMEYDWPGNVRELRNILERAFILQKGPIYRPSELLILRGRCPVGSPEPCMVVPSRPAEEEQSLTSLAQMEKNYIRYSLEKNSHNLTRTSKSLGISLSTLKRKIREYGLVPQ